MILILLVANIGFIPNAYADGAGSTSNSLQSSDTSVNSGNVTQGGSTAPSQDDSATVNSSASASSPSTTSSASNNPALPSNFSLSGAKTPQADGFHMMQVNNMPDVINKTTVSTSKKNNANQAVARNNNGPSVASSVYDDPNLYDSGQSQSGVAGAVYAQASVSSSVYGSVYSSFPIRNKSGRFTVGFSRQSGNSLLQFSYRNAGVTLAPFSAASVCGSVYQNSITYKEIYPNTDLKYTVEPDRLKESLILEKYTGQSDFLFQLSVSNAVYKAVYGGGSISFCDPKSGESLFYMPRPFAIDKNGKRCDLISSIIYQEM
jgi:hypothetical protein